MIYLPRTNIFNFKLHFKLHFKILNSILNSILKKSSLKYKKTHFYKNIAESISKIHMI